MNDPQHGAIHEVNLKLHLSYLLLELSPGLSKAPMRGPFTPPMKGFGVRMEVGYVPSLFQPTVAGAANQRLRLKLATVQVLIVLHSIFITKLKLIANISKSRDFT